VHVIKILPKNCLIAVHGHLVIKWIEQWRQNDVISLEFLINLFLTDDEFYEYLDFILLTALNFPDISHSPSVTNGIAT